MTHSELTRAIETGKIPGLLFLYGDETFLRERAVQRLCDAVTPAAARDFNYHVFHGRGGQAAEILDHARTLPVFAPRRLVLVKEAHELPAAELDTLLPYLRDPAPQTVLLFTADKIDGRKKFFQEFKKYGVLVEFRRLYDNQIPAFIREQSREAGRAFTEEALTLFCRRVGSSLQEVHGELTKLFAYLGERTLVDVADVAAVVSDTRADSIFDLTNAVGQGKPGEAVRLLGRLLDEGVAPLVILTMLARHFRQLWKIRELLDQGVGGREIPGRVGVNPYFVEGLMAQARKSSSGRFRQAFELFLETDLALKSSGAHPAALLEKLVLEITLAAQAGRRA